MNIKRWLIGLGRVTLVLGLALGPWPAALAVTDAVPRQTVATHPADGDAPCPMDAPAAAVPCHCCDPGTPCDGMPCALATPAGVPAAATVAMPLGGARYSADFVTRPPAARPGERLRPPIA